MLLCTTPSRITQRRAGCFHWNITLTRSNCGLVCPGVDWHRFEECDDEDLDSSRSAHIHAIEMTSWSEATSVRDLHIDRFEAYLGADVEGSARQNVFSSKDKRG